MTHHWIGAHLNVLGHVHHVQGNTSHALGVILTMVWQPRDGHVLIADSFHLNGRGIKRVRGRENVENLCDLWGTFVGGAKLSADPNSQKCSLWLGMQCLRTEKA